MLHAGEIDGSTKKGKIQPFLDLLLPTIRAVYKPRQHIAKDESVIAFKGRVACLQYLKGKPHPWGIKAYVLADSKSAYMHNVVIYYGKETELVREDLQHNTKVVLTLLDDLHHKGYDLYVDRFYSSPQLVMELDTIGVTVTGNLPISYQIYYYFQLGTVMSNRKGLPLAVKSKAKKPRGTVEAYCSGKILCLSWTDKRNVLMLSTKHKAGMMQVQSR